jgi:hypothetical protein
MTPEDIEALADAIAVAQELAERLRVLLDRVCLSKRKCRLCPAMLYFVRGPRDVGIVAYSAEGLDHYEDCPGVHGRFEVRDAEQSRLFDCAPDALEPKR